MLNLGTLGIWFSHNAMPIADSVAFARGVEAYGYGTLWIPEAIGREPFVHLAYLASQTSSLVLATGIANIWARDAVTMAAAQKTLTWMSLKRDSKPITTRGQIMCVFCRCPSRGDCPIWQPLRR